MVPMYKPSVSSITMQPSKTMDVHLYMYIDSYVDLCPLYTYASYCCDISHYGKMDIPVVTCLSNVRHSFAALGTLCWRDTQSWQGHILKLYRSTSCLYRARVHVNSRDHV